MKDADKKGEEGEKARVKGSKLYVGNLSFKLSSDDLIKHFSEILVLKEALSYLIQEENPKVSVSYLLTNQNIDDVISKANGRIGGRNLKVAKATENKSKEIQRKANQRKG